MGGIKRITKKGFVIPLSTERGKRFEWLSKVINDNNYTIGAEVGAHTGQTTSYLATNCKNLKRLYAVDLWAKPPIQCSDQYDGWDFVKSEITFKNRTKGMQCIHVLKGVSWEIVQMVPDNSLDFVFIDADHKYESVFKDIKAWTPKLKDGGMISGHDTHFKDVLKAIDELIPNWEAAGIDHCWFARKEDVL